MARICCRFRAGKIYFEAPRTVPARKRILLLGNGWRGLLVIAGTLLLIYKLWELGLIVLGLACFWSIAEKSIKNWRNIYAREKALRYLRQGRAEEALAICAEPEPLSLIWWWYLVTLLKGQRWAEAVSCLEQAKAGKERDYLLAVAHLGNNLPGEALSLCPLCPEEPWRTLKAEALFKAEEWQKVLGVLRGAAGKSRDLEHIWLKGGSYFFLGQYKPAVKLLRQVAEQGSADYAGAQEWLKQALLKLE